MSQRLIVPSAQCSVCKTIAVRVGSTIFCAGYVAGVRRVSKGALANESFCVIHATEIDEALAQYIGKGIEE